MSISIIKIQLLGLVFLAACQSKPTNVGASLSPNTDKNQRETISNITAAAEEKHKGKKPANAATILARKQVPILCYHQIRDWKASDSQSAKDYIAPVNTFKAQIKMLADSGYHSILPDQLVIKK